jgi:uncharacterized protein (TIGR02118 family)
MTRVLAIYNQPADPAKFDAYYYSTHIPLARKIPGLRGMRLSKEKPLSIAGMAPYLIAELDFDSLARSRRPWLRRKDRPPPRTWGTTHKQE